VAARPVPGEPAGEPEEPSGPPTAEQVARWRRLAGNADRGIAEVAREQLRRHGLEAGG